jgi:hypothetical protein
MSITNNKVISRKFININIRTNHGQTEIVMQYERFAEFSNVCDHLLQQRQLRISDAYNQSIVG